MHDIDVLTGLPNRLGLAARLDRAMAAARRDGGSAAVLFIDLDGFKTVNDTRGHAVGDAVLRELAARLRARIRDTDTVARLGGDEFVVIAERVDDAGRASMLAGKLLTVIGEPIAVHDESVGITASIGISLFPDDGATADALIGAADAAMYAAKADGRNAFRYYSPRMHADAQTRLALEQALGRGLEAGQFELQYQPEWNVATGGVSAAVAQLRWCRPALGPVAAADFMSVADQCGVSVPLGRWMLATACDDAARLRALGLTLPIAVPLSARQVTDRSLVRELGRLLGERRLPADAIGIDVSEETTASQRRDVAASLGDLGALGVALAITGFGTGCSSIGSLTTLPIGSVKLAAAVVARASDDELDTTLAAGLVALGRHLGLGVVADGVDSAAAAERLAAIGCQRMQGAYIARPLAVAELIAYCRWARSPLVSAGRERGAARRRHAVTPRPTLATTPDAPRYGAR